MPFRRLSCSIKKAWNNILRLSGKSPAEGQVLLLVTPYYIGQMKENRSGSAIGQPVEKFEGDATGFS
jgi:hypothetical protein